MDASIGHSPNMSDVMDQLKAAKSERSAIQNELRAMRHQMTDFWMADTVQRMSADDGKVAKDHCHTSSRVISL